MGGIYHVGSHGEQFSLVMVRCLGYFCNWLLHFDRDLLFMLLSKMISLSPVIMPYDLLTAMPDFHLFFGDQTIPREPCPHEKDA